ncbi:hypothetical protein V6N13_036701 [Hibiscus sabdariffa]
MAIFCDYCGENHSLQNCPYNLDAYGYMEDQNWNQQQNFSWFDQNTQNFLYHNNFAAAADRPWQYQPSYEHSNPLEQTFPTFATSFDRLLEEMQNLNKSMEARLVKMDERMINWGGSTSVMDKMPKGTEIPREEVSEQCEENSSMPRKHARAGVTSYMWAGVATSSNATTTSQDAAKSDASANSTESDAENDTITLMLKHETTCPGSTEATRTGSTEVVCLGSKKPVCPGSTQKFCPGNKLTFCFSGEQNECFNGNCLSDKITDCLENEAQSMVIPPTIYVAPKSLLMEMFKKSEDNDTWKLDDFKKDVPSIDFHRILAEDCHSNWVEQQLPQQRRLHQTMMEVKANKVIKWLDVITIFPNPIFMPSGTIARWSVYMNFKGKRNKDISTVAVQREVAEIPLAQFLPRHHHQKTDLAQRIDQSKRRRMTFMAYPRDFNKVNNQVIKDKFPEASMRSQCLNRNLPTSLPWHHIPTRQKLVLSFIFFLFFTFACIEDNANLEFGGDCG